MAVEDDKRALQALWALVPLLSRDDLSPADARQWATTHGVAAEFEASHFTPSQVALATLALPTPVSERALERQLGAPTVFGRRMLWERMYAVPTPGSRYRVDLIVPGRKGPARSATLRRGPKTA